MNLVIPPLLFYAFGAILVSLGGMRAYYLGWLKRPEIDEDEEAGEDREDLDVRRGTGAARPTPGGGEADPAAAAAAPTTDESESEPDEVAPIETARRKRGFAGGPGGHRRHLFMGLLYMAMGIFLIISTLLGQRR